MSPAPSPVGIRLQSLGTSTLGGRGRRGRHRPARHHHRVGIGGVTVLGRHLHLDGVCARRQCRLEAGLERVRVREHRVRGVQVRERRVVVRRRLDGDFVHGVEHVRGVGFRAARKGLVQIDRAVVRGVLQRQIAQGGVGGEGGGLCQREGDTVSGAPAHAGTVPSPECGRFAIGVLEGEGRAVDVQRQGLRVGCKVRVEGDFQLSVRTEKDDRDRIVGAVVREVIVSEVDAAEIIREEVAAAEHPGVIPDGQRARPDLGLRLGLKGQGQERGEGQEQPGRNAPPRTRRGADAPAGSEDGSRGPACVGAAHRRETGAPEDAGQAASRRTAVLTVTGKRRRRT